MTLLANRPKTAISEKQVIERDGHMPMDRKISPMPAAPEETLRTLRARLQSQLEKSDGKSDPVDINPEGRFLIESVHRRLKQVNAALARIEVGEYGVCTDCQALIESDRLVIQPMSTRCTRCQAVADWRGVNY